MAPSLDLHALGEQIAEDVAHLAAANHRLLTRIRIFDAGDSWLRQGFRSCAQWLSWRVGWTQTTAREHVRVARALAALPAIDGALARGELSYCKVRAVTRVATPENEQVLLEQARLTTGQQLETICRKYASCRRHDADARHPVDDELRRYVRRRDTNDGMVIIEAALHPDEAAVVWAALERVATERARRASSAAGDLVASAEAPASVTAARAEAAPAVVAATSSESAGACVEHCTKTTMRTDSCRAGSAASAEAFAFMPARQPRPAFDRADAFVEMATDIVRGTRRDRTPTELVIAISVDSLAADAATDPANVGCSRDGSVISPAAVRRLACDAGIVAALEDEAGNTLGLGRKQRTISGSMKRALLRRDRTCRFPGCRARVFLEGHHIEHWADGGATDLSNLVSVCSFHHRFVHEYGFAIELQADGRVVAFDADGRRIPEVAPVAQPPALGWPTIERRNARLDVSAETLPTWDGTPVDYHACVAWLCETDDVAPDCRGSTRQDETPRSRDGA